MKIGFHLLFLCSTLGACGCVGRNTTEYEYIVIGSGPGGGPLAANLAREGHSVLLLEAGENRDDLLLQVPRWADADAETDDLSWRFWTNHYQNETMAQQDKAFTYQLTNGSLYVGLDPPEGAIPKGIFYPRGNTVGGSANANAMNIVLPRDDDWNHIADSTGDESWRAEKMRDHFVELERNTYMPPGTPGYGHDGYIGTNRNNITYVTDSAGTMRVVRNALLMTEGVEDASEDEVVSRMERDLNRPDAPDRYSPGVYQVPLHVDENRRRTSPHDYIQSTLAAKAEDGSARYPLTLSTRSLARKVLFEKTHGKPKAVGVEYEVGTALYEGDRRYDPSVHGIKKTARATREVIVAGGAFNTPQILKLSGVGPREELEQHGIPVVADLPAVGNYLRDNYEIGINLQSTKIWENPAGADCLWDPSTATPSNDPCLAQWEQGYGVYGEGAAPIFLLYRSSVAPTEDTDMIIFGSAGTVFDGHYPGYSSVPWPPTSFFWVVVKMPSENNAGTVTLKSANPRELPEINFNFFEKDADTDLQALGEGLQHMLNIMNATGEPYEPFTFVEPAAGFDSDLSSLAQHTRTRTWGHHAQGSCRMGPKDNTDYCVDSEFKVNGVDGLRVVDGSIFPVNMAGFPVGATFTISQKAFHAIIGDATK
ncbi:alcohol oxidase [Xylariaceae sp. FL1019]|nr:alcohol oxidase [Xylariaceae sp. FL1019]